MPSLLTCHANLSPQLLRQREKNHTQQNEYTDYQNKYNIVDTPEFGSGMSVHAPGTDPNCGTAIHSPLEDGDYPMWLQQLFQKPSGSTHWVPEPWTAPGGTQPHQGEPWSHQPGTLQEHKAGQKPCSQAWQ